MITTREDLIQALGTAAELEHSVCCMYLFTAFTLKRSPEEGVSWAQAETGRGWMATLLGIAREEMGHLGTVLNLLAAVGGAPHLWHPPFPSAGPFASPDTRLELLPFSLEAVERFVRFEAAESMLEEEIGEGPPRTVAGLYRGIRAAFERLDERVLFIGPASAQLRIEFPTAAKLNVIEGRWSALQAIDRLVAEGEGSAGSHLERFQKMKDELLLELEREPGFAPSRPTVRNPVAGAGGEIVGTSPVTDPGACAAMDLFDRAYRAMLLCLYRLSAATTETTAELELLQSTAYYPLMTMVLRPLGEMLTLAPAGERFPDRTAGPSFETAGMLDLPADKRAAWLRLKDLLQEVADAGAAVAGRGLLGPRGSFLSENLTRIAANFARGLRS